MKQCDCLITLVKQTQLGFAGWSITLKSTGYAQNKWLHSHLMPSQVHTVGSKGDNLSGRKNPNPKTWVN